MRVPDPPGAGLLGATSFDRSYGDRRRDAVPVRGCLVWVFLPHIALEPMTLTPVGRTEPTEHSSATFIIAPLSVNTPRRDRDLPVAALPLNPGEMYTVHRAKRRPAIVLSVASEIPRSEAPYSARQLTNATMIVAPAYGAVPDGTRAGIPERLRTRIWRCEYPQFLMDKLPIPGPSESLIRFDQAMPVPWHPNAYEQTGYRLSDEAMALVDEWLRWFSTGKPPTDGVLFEALQMIRELGGATP